MNDNRIKAIQFEGYKSFPTGTVNELDLTPLISVLIGKNNCGKSSCIDAIECVFKPHHYASVNSLFTRVSPIFELDTKNIESGFSKNMGGGDVPGSTHYSYGSKFVGKSITTNLSTTSSGSNKFLSLELNQSQPDLKLTEASLEWGIVVRSYNNFQSYYEFRRINADRDLIPEIESGNELVGYDGTGATNLLRKFVNHNLYDEKLVEESLLQELNKIMEPDSHFKNIRLQQIDEADSIKWEIFLEEDDGRRFALSKSGSGLKTIILMLINLYILPTTKKYKNKDIIFAFEELENNLHPALQRKVFEYLYDFAVKNNVHIFLTTHSHIAINTFFEKERTALYHVQKNNGISKLTSITNRESRLDVLSDLDVKASDLFQSNGVIWVEGPSDRIYINRWLKVFCNSEYIEGSHYQFLYYGGKNLAHITANDNLDDLISILKTNQNAAIVIDSDKKSENERINKTKSRIKKEFDSINGFCWITKGKEIENYISTDTLRQKYGDTMPELGSYVLFPDYIKIKCKSFSSQKVAFAKSIVEYITIDNSKDIMDLKKQVEKLYSLIEKWNQ